VPKTPKKAPQPAPQPATPSLEGVAWAVPPVWSLVALGVAVVVGAVLRFRGLGAPSLWTDELVSWWAASAATTGQVLSRVTGCMATPPLSSLAQHVTLGMFGESEWALRLPSAVAGVLTIPLIFLAGWRMFGAAAGAVAALFLALHPFHLWWSTDGRPYGLAVLFAAGATWSLAEAVRTGCWRSAAGWAVCTAGLLYSQFVFLPLPIFQILAYVVLRRTGRAPALAPARMGMAVGGAALLCVPLLPQMLAVGRRAPGLTWPSFIGNYPPGIYGLLQTTALMTGALLFLLYLSARTTGDELPGRPAVRDRAGDLLLVLLSFLGPLLLLGAVALLRDLPTLVRPRYGAAYVAPAVLLAGWATTLPARRGGKILFAGSFLVLLAATAVVPTLRRGESFNQNANVEDWRSAIELLASERQPGDLVLIRSGLIETASVYAGAFPSACDDYVTAPLSGPYLEGDVDAILLPMTFADPAPLDYARRFGERLAGRSRVWLLMMHPDDPGQYFGRLEAYLRRASGLPLQVARAGTFGPVTVALLAVPSG
jgi:4-amino-4-deoxy-L-arabinose transferase-like glycosyltransferase